MRETRMVAYSNSEYNKIEKLLKLNDPETFWDDVRKLTRRVTSGRSIREWLILAEIRYSELLEVQA